jgi:hypothetical protein
MSRKGPVHVAVQSMVVFRHANDRSSDSDTYTQLLQTANVSYTGQVQLLVGHDSDISGRVPLPRVIG